jgi:MFS family permease
MSLSVDRLSSGSLRQVLSAYDLVFLIALIWFMVQFLRYVFPPLFGTFQASYGVSNTQTGLMFSLLMFGYSAMQFPGGLLADRYHEVTVLVGGAVVFTFAAVCVFFAPTFTLLTVAAVGIGIGTGVHKTVAVPYLSRMYPDRTGLSLGIMDTIGQFGGMCAPIVVVIFLRSVFPWRTVFLLGALVSALLAALLLYRAHPSKLERRHGHEAVDNTPATDQDGGEEPDEDESTAAGSYLTIFADRNLLAFLLVTMLFTFAWNGLSAFFPLFLVDEKGLSPGLAGIAYSLLFAASLSQMVTGSASDTVGKPAISLVLFVGMILGLSALIATSSVVLIFGLTILTGIGFHGFRPVRDAYLMDLIPSSIGGGTFGIVRTGMTATGGIAPSVIGLVSDLFGYTVAFGLIVCALVCGLGLLVVLR